MSVSLQKMAEHSPSKFPHLNNPELEDVRQTCQFLSVSSSTKRCVCVNSVRTGTKQDAKLKQFSSYFN